MDSSSKRNLKMCLRKYISCLERKQFSAGGSAVCTMSTGTRMAAGYLSGSNASPSASLGLFPAPKCLCALGLWISLWILDRILAGEGASVLAGHMRNAVWREDALSPPAFAWGLPGWCSRPLICSQPEYVQMQLHQLAGGKEMLPLCLRQGWSPLFLSSLSNSVHLLLLSNLFSLFNSSEAS